ncbi:MAG: hypothetical protein ACQKBT_09535, partial [Puniceicoccales bacterium]
MFSIVRSKQRPQKSGFALIVALSILAFVVLVLVSLSAMIRVEMGISNNAMRKTEAKQNSLLAMNIALGELQKLTGPDQRVTATADIAAAGDGSRLPAGDVAQNTQSVNGTENGLSVNGDPSVQTGTRWWTGVWGRAGASYSTPALSVFEETPSPVLLKWLVSGNEGISYGIDTDGWVSSANSSQFTPGDLVNWAAAGLNPNDPSSWNGFSGYSNLEIQSSGQKAVLLVGPSSAGEDPIDGEVATERYVIAPLEELAESSSGGVPTGRYAWWVGDEGVKASYALADPYPGSNSPFANSSSGAEARLRLMSASRSGIEILPGWENYPDAEDSTAASSFERITLLNDARLVDSSLLEETLRESFHDITPYASGLLVDVLNGGLKTDLTYYFESASNWNGSPLEGEGIIPDAYSPLWSSGEYAPKWDWLYSFYNTNPSVSNASLSLRAETGTVLGISPIITQLRMIFFTEDPRYTNFDVKNLVNEETYSLPIRCNVAIVLANPYNFTLNVPDNGIRFVLKNDGKEAGDRGLIIRAATGKGKGTDLATYGILRGPGNTVETTGLLDTVEFSVPNSFSIDPGETVTLSVDGNSQVLSGTNAPEDPPVNTIELAVRSASNPILSSHYFSAADTVDFSTSADNNAGIALYQYRSDMNLTMENASGEVLQRIEHFQINKDNQLNSFAGNVLGSAHLKFIGPAHRNLDWKTDSTLKNEFSNYVISRPFQDFNVRAKTVTHPNSDYIEGVYWVKSPPSYGVGVLYSAAGGTGAGGNITSAFTDTLHPASWAEDFDYDLRQAADSGVMFDYPRRASNQLPVLSIGQLQHANIVTDDENLEGTINFMTGYAIGNSYFNPYLSREKTVDERSVNFSTNTGSTKRFFDLSYLLNTALWDGYFFSGIPQSGSDYNPQNLRYELDPDTTSSEARSPMSAEYLTVEGAFNINSTSKNAWKALLGGLNGLRVNDDGTDDGSPFPRTLWQPEDNVKTGNSYQTSGSGDTAYAGYRRLNDAEIDLLAEEIVKRVRARGPFVSLSQFINRTLVAATDDFNEDVNDANSSGDLAAPTVPQGRGLSGPLQAAIDSVASGINTFIEVNGDQVEADASGGYGDRVLFNGEVVHSTQFI